MKINAQQLGKIELGQPSHGYFSAEGKLQEKKKRKVVHNLIILTLMKPIANILVMICN